MFVIGVIAAFTAISAVQVSAETPVKPPASVAFQPVTTRELVEVGGLSGLSISPDGRHAAIRLERDDLSTNRTILDWQIVDLSSGKLSTPIDAGGANWNRGGGLETELPQWSPDSRTLYFRALHGEEMQIWRSSLDGRRVEQVTREPADVISFAVQSSGVVEYATAGASRDEIKAAEKAEVERGVVLDGTLVSGFPLAYGFPVNGRNVTYRYLQATSGSVGTLLGDRIPLLFTRDLAGNRRRVIDPDALSRVSAPDVLGSGRFAVRVSGRLQSSGDGLEHVNPGGAVARLLDLPDDHPTGLPRPRLVSRSADGETITCVDPACSTPASLAVVGWAKGDDEIVFQASTLATDWLRAWNVRTGRVRDILEWNGVLGSAHSGSGGICEIAGRSVLCIASSAGRPPQLLAIDIATGEQRVILDPNPTLSPEKLGDVRTVLLRDRFEGATYGQLVLPKKRLPGERLPLVITSYTCTGFLQGGSGRDVPEHVLAGLGYASMCIDLGVDYVVRPPGFLHTTQSANESSLDFFMDAIRQLEAEGLVDGRRVVVSGFSGSSTSLQYQMTQTDRFTAAIVTTKGSMDAISCYLAAPRNMCWKSAVNAGFVRKPFDTRSGYMSSSPAWNAERIRTPLLMQLAEVEHRDMMQLWSALTEYDRAVEMIVFPGAYHIKNIPRQRLSVYDRNVDWIEFWIRGVERADTSQQYVRWRHMRQTQCAGLREKNVQTKPVYCG